MTDAERLLARVGPRALRWLADHFDEMRSPGSVEIAIDHGPGGRVMRMTAAVQKVLDLTQKEA